MTLIWHRIQIGGVHADPIDCSLGHCVLSDVGLLIVVLLDIERVVAEKLVINRRRQERQFLGRASFIIVMFDREPLLHIFLPGYR